MLIRRPDITAKTAAKAGTTARVPPTSAPNAGAATAIAVIEPTHAAQPTADMRSRGHTIATSATTTADAPISPNDRLPEALEAAGDRGRVAERRVDLQRSPGDHIDHQRQPQHADERRDGRVRAVPRGHADHDGCDERRHDGHGHDHEVER